MKKPLTMTREQEGRIRDIADDMGMEYGDEIRDLLAEIDALREGVPRTDPRPLAGGRISRTSCPSGYASLHAVGGDVRYLLGDVNVGCRGELAAHGMLLRQGQRCDVRFGEHVALAWQGNTPGTMVEHEG